MTICVNSSVMLGEWLLLDYCMISSVESQGSLSLSLSCSCQFNFFSYPCVVLWVEYFVLDVL